MPRRSRAKTPDLVGITEIAAMAGVSNSAVANWTRRHSDFPEPVLRLAMGPAWDAAEVRVWLRENRKI